MELFDLNEKVAIITGGNRGIGFAVARGLAKSGAAVIIANRNADAGQKAAFAIRNDGFSATSVPTDVADKKSVENLVATVLEDFDRIDILVNSAGVIDRGPVEDFTEEQYDYIMDINLKGLFFCCQLVGKEMIKNNRGKIINISSYAGSKGTDPIYLDAISYNTSKGALNTFTMDLAVKWAKYNINVNAIAPGWFPTKITEWSFSHQGEAILARTPMKRFGRLNELKGIVVFLSSKASDFLTGQVIGVDGGLSAW